ncbi:hypothetical protein L210DRAFT_3631486 [Boletus edulis BED1]|uniref:Uncharacterized protein n=1 Tax=Boletus edulis BED1 TaxID=1328754 RepID=A0AAD4BR63_BOLED|nr:hypothetical protein L210DRAFT_3631486 [Boletus edulis BED1]
MWLSIPFWRLLSIVSRADSVPAPPLSCSPSTPLHLFSSMRVNGLLVNGCFDELVLRCQLSQAVAVSLGIEPPNTRAVVQAVYIGTSFTADVPVEVTDIDCDLIIGHEWISLLNVVSNDTRSVVRRDSPHVPSLSLPESTSCVTSPPSGLCILCHSERTSSGLLLDSNEARALSISFLETFLYPEASSSPEGFIFSSDVGLSSMNRVACNEVNRGLSDQSEVVSILLSSVLRADVRYLTDRLSLIARAVGLLNSGAKVERRNLVSMLDSLRLGCVSSTHNVEPDQLFGGFDRLKRDVLLSLGFGHGVSLTGSAEQMRDRIMLHLTNGDCVVHASVGHSVCNAFVARYLHDLPSSDKDDKDVLQI